MRSLLSSIGLLFLLALIGLAGCSSSDEPADDGASPTTVEDCVADGTCSAGPEGTIAAAPTSNGWTVAGEYLGLPVGLTNEGFPFLGDPDAPVTVMEFSDYLCPFCARHSTQTAPALFLEYGNSGEVNFVFRDFPLEALHPTAASGHQAALCVIEQDVALFWEYHDILFRDQDAWSSLGDPLDYLETTAAALDVDMASYGDCMDSGRTALMVERRVSAGNAAGFRGTPSFQLINNADGASYDIVGAQPLPVFAGAIDAFLAGETPTGLSPSPGSASIDVEEVIPEFTADPATQDVYNGRTVGFTGEGLPFIGDPDAPVTVLEYSDYLCPFCFRHTTETAPSLLDQYADSGEVNFVFIDLPLVSLHPTAPLGHQAALCVGEQGAAFFWAYHDSLFFNQSQWSGLPDPSAFLGETVAAVGADAAAYEECMESGRTVPLVDERVARGTGNGFNGTPSFQFLDNASGDVYELVGAYPLTTFQEYLDAMIAGEEPPDPNADQPEAELPFWARPEGLAPDPARPGFTLAGDPYKGDPDAPVVVVEFSDFQCPSCQRHALETQPVIDETFVDTGQIMWVFKHLPLGIHPQAALAAAAAECAGEQGAFFEMDSALFASQERWSIEDPDPVFVELAGEVGLDTGAFATCLQGRTALERVLADMYDATGVASETPTFVVLHSGRGALFTGARDADDFVAILQSQVDAATDDGS